MKPGHKELILVLGGARSGKSSFALKYVEQHFDSYLFLASARAMDKEMKERVRLHVADRGPEWHVLEEPIEIPAALTSKCGHVQAVLVDCLTIWMSNLLLELGEDHIPDYEARFIEALLNRNQAVVLVSNEVGLGIVPEHPLGRQFRDHAGRLNQKVAAIADKVIFTVAGLPTYLKGDDHEPPI